VKCPLLGEKRTLCDHRKLVAFAKADTRALLRGRQIYGTGWFNCKDCRRKFTAAVGAIYERSHIQLTKWFLATHLMA